MLLSGSSQPSSRMAWYWRNNYWRPRNRYYRRYRRRNYRGFNRRTFRSRYRRVRWRRLRKGRRKRAFTVTQFNPLYKRRCTITIVAPLLFTLGAQNAIQDFYLPITELITSWRGGGVDSGTMSLLDLFWEERFWRARWSASNQGFDMLRYYGCKLTLWPSEYYSYIFWYSTEDFSEDKTPLTVCHPSQLMLQRHHVVVTSWQSTGKRKPITIKIRPPTALIGVWMKFAELATKPLVKWRVSLIDLENPWTGFPTGTTTKTSGVHFTIWARENQSSEAKSWDIWYFPMLDEGQKTKVCFQTIKWNSDGNGPKVDEAGFWPTNVQYETLLVPFYMYVFGRNPEWYHTQETIHRPAPTDSSKGYFLFIQFNGNTAYRGAQGGLPAVKEGYIKYESCADVAASGPWVCKSVGAAFNASYRGKFFFQWGGTPGTQLPPVAPAEGPPHWPKAAYRFGNSLRADIRDPRSVGEEVLRESDLDSSGIITEKALARITKPPLSTEYSTAQKRKIWGYPHGEDPYERRRLKRRYYKKEGSPQTDDSTSEEEQSSDETLRDYSSETEAKKERHLRKRRVLRLLELLRGRGVSRTGSTSHFGRERYSSI
ncbi:ORF1 [Neotofec virus RodL2_5]|uniref:Capsid protein n=1 Tax=Neotofec virus RodL2_5 TaxID=2929218 RepID=A0A976N1W0_9VIRU|nr:ORF1 [Neotofec virus RodL2_5]